MNQDIYSQYVYVNKLKIRRNYSVMHEVYRQYVRSGFALSYTSACVIHALVNRS